jgi:transcriptional regulator with XRE-family HTH domain
MKTKLGSRKRNHKNAQTVRGNGDDLDMQKTKSIVQIVAENTATLMWYDPKTKRSRIPQSFLAKKGVSQATIGRILRAAVETNIGHVEKIAAEFGLEAWQLLVDDLDPALPPLLIPQPVVDELARRVGQAHQQRLLTSGKKPTKPNAV